jgi:hypothetical protein
MGEPKDKGQSMFRSDLNKFAEILGIKEKDENDFDAHVEYMIEKYSGKRVSLR